MTINFISEPETSNDATSPSWSQKSTTSTAGSITSHKNLPIEKISRKITKPSKFSKQTLHIQQELCFGMKPPPCIVSLRKKTRNLRRKRRQPYSAILVGAFLMRLESQAVKTRPKRKPLDIDRIKKGSRLESFMTKLTAISKSKKTISNVLVPIQPWSSNRSISTSKQVSSTSSSVSASFPQQTAQPPAPVAATRTVKSELCPVTETCTAATMPPSSPSSNRNKGKQTPSHQKSGISHYRSETLATPSTPEGIRKSVCSSPKPITPTIARIKTDPSNHNMHRLHHASTSLISPDLQRVRVDIGHTPLLPHHGHLISNLQNPSSQQSKMETSNSPFRDTSPFISPRKRMLLDQETNGSPSKKHRLSTDSGGSGGSSEGVRSSMGSPSLNQHPRVGSPAAGIPYGASPPRIPHGAQTKSNSFSIDSIMSSRTSQDERDTATNTIKSNPIRPVAIPASPMRVSDIKRDHEREEMIHRSRSISGSPPHTPIPLQQKGGVSPPPMTTPSIVVPITPYQSRGMDPSTPIDPRLAHLAGLIADPRLGLTPTRGSPFPYPTAGIGAVPGMNPYYPFQLAAAASVAGLWTPPPASTATTTIASNTSSPLDVVTPVRSTPSNFLQEKSSSSTPQRGGNSTFSPWGPQMSYRGEPRVSTTSSSGPVTSKATDLSKPDAVGAGKSWAHFDFSIFA